MKLRSYVMPLIIVNIVFFILQGMIDGFTNNLLLVSDDIFLRPWILITSLFLHGSSFHLLFNMYGLFIFGPLVESRLGSKKFLYSYFISGIIASLAFSFTNLGSSALGASGAVMGIIGIVIILFPNLQVLLFFFIPMSMRTAGIIFAGIDILGAFSNSTGIAHIAHLGGLATGLYIGYKNRKFSFNRPREKQYHGLNLQASQEEIDTYFRMKK